ncbi:MAG: phosphoribosylanthranilate isomerase [Mucilaginibacter sp.]
MKIKVCGMKYPDNIAEVAGLEPDYLGFICYPQSPRFINDLQAINTPKTILRTGVFVNESADKVEELIETYQFNAIQLHGEESPDFCELFKNKVIVIKAFGIDENFDFEQLEAYEGKADLFLFDTKTNKHGGSGLTFDWTLLNQYKLDTPFLLSGGLSLENLKEVKNIDHPQFYGVDLNSKFETGPGLKDINKLKKAFEILR